MKIIILIGIFLMSGCAALTPEPKVVYKEVKVPVYSCPNSFETVTVPPRPRLMIEQFEHTKCEGKGCLKIFKAYVASIKQLKQHVEKLERYPKMINNTCRIPGEANETQ